MFRPAHRKHLTPKGKLSLFQATIAGVGIIVGAGIYVLIGNATAIAGTHVWISFIVAGLIALLTGLSYAELSSIYVDDSGEYGYVEHAFGKVAAFMVGYLVLLSGLIGAAAVAMGFSNYLHAFIPIISEKILAIGAVILFSLIVALGVKQSMRITVLFTVLSIAGLLSIIFFAIPYMGNVALIESIKFLPIIKASSLIFFAFLGFEGVIKLSEETDEPKKNMPKALLYSLAISSAIYILVAIGALSVIGPDRLGSSASPLYDVAKVLLGNYAGVALGIIALLSTANTLLLLLIAMSNMIHRMSFDYPKLQWLTNDTRYSLIICTIITLLFVILNNIEMVATMSNFGVFVVFGIINATLIKTRYLNHDKEMFHEPFNLGKFPLLALIAIITLLPMIFSMRPIVIIMGIGLTMGSLFIYQFINLKQTQVN